MLAAVLQRPTLVLNRDWTPIQTTTTRHAIGLVANGAARIIDPSTYDVHDLDSWDALTRARERFEGAVIRSMRLALEPPEVIVLTAYHGLGKRSVVFSRGNLFRRDHFTCQYCGSQPGTRELTIDHILPRSRGGKSTWDNCVVACFQCNCLKADRMPEEAGMVLRKMPTKPSWSAILPGPSRLRLESWKRFVSDAYWEVELKP
jgi:5-methylcytosine-specific restriction endonuclease McrA